MLQVHFEREVVAICTDGQDWTPVEGHVLDEVSFSVPSEGSEYPVYLLLSSGEVGPWNGFSSWSCLYDFASFSLGDRWWAVTWCCPPLECRPPTNSPESLTMRILLG